MAGVSRIVMLSFLRAREDGPTTYHRSKWAAEELVRNSGLSWTVLKAGVIHGRGDHLLDHVSRAVQTVPIFGLVGLRPTLLRPVAVGDVVRVLAAAALGDSRISNRTIAVLGPETVTLEEAVRRIGRSVGRTPRFVPLPVGVHRWLARIWEATMRVPLLSRAQVEILAEGVVEPLPFAQETPGDLRPRTPFSEAAIRAGLPQPGGFGLADLRCRPVRSD
jgi:NADH dehydrogenase